MTRKKIKQITIALILILSIFLVYNVVKKIDRQVQVKQLIQRYPSLHIINLDSTFTTTLNNSSERKLIIYFNSKCEYCRYEAQQLKENIEFIGDFRIYMLSSENLNDIRKFAESNKLGSIKKIVFGQVSIKEVVEKIGNLKVPHILIYNYDGTLLKEFRGETKIDAILKYLRQN